MAMISVRPGGNDAAPIRWGYLIVADEHGTNEEPISERATIALTEHFDLLKRILGEINAATIYSGKAIVPEVGLGFAINELCRLLGLGEMWNVARELTPLEQLIAAGLTADGAHHKQWYLERIADRLGLHVPPHDPGVAP